MTQLSTIETDRAPAPIGPYSQAIKAGNTVYVSGQIAMDPASGELDNADVATETQRALDNLSHVLKAAGADLNCVCKVTIYLTDFNDFNAVNAVYGEYFSLHQPARTCIEVSRLPKDARIEMDAIAVIT